MAKTSIDQQVYAEMQKVAALKVSGSYKSGDVPQSMFKEALEEWSATRTTPSMIPYVDGRVVTLAEYKQVILDNLSNLREVYSRVALKQGSGEGSVPWDSVRQAHTDVTGARKDSTTSRIEQIRQGNFPVVETSHPPTSPLSTWAVNQYRLYLQKGNLKGPTGKAFTFGVVYTPSNPSEPLQGLLYKAQALNVREDGTLAGTSGGGVASWESFYPTDKSGNLHTPPGESLGGEPSLVTDTETGLGVFFDIEHFRESVAADSIHRIILGLNRVKNLAVQDLNKSKDAEQVRLLTQVIKDLDAQIVAAEENLLLAKKVGRVLSDVLDKNISTSQFAALVKQMPKEAAHAGVYLLFYSQTTDSHNLELIKTTHEVQADFMPGLSKFNSGIAAALEKAALQSVRDALLTPASPSAFTRALFGVLGRIFSAPEFVATIKKNQKGAKKKFLGRTFVPIFRLNSTKEIRPKKTKVKGPPKSRGRKALRRWDKIFSPPKQSIVSLMNAEIKNYVLEQMTYPSLQNRSGTFASSVRILSAQENAAIAYTYRKSPYQVFSLKTGKRSWATEARDPATIIDKAIKKLGQDRFQKVFRTEER